MKIGKNQRNSTSDSISGGAAYRGHTESKLASRSERCSGHRERCAPVDNPGDLKANGEAPVIGRPENR